MGPSPWKNERNKIQCCRHCVPPKRYPGCGGHCEEYKKEKAKYLEDKERDRKDKEMHPVLSFNDFN